MLRRVSNEIEIYEAQKKLDGLLARSMKSESLFSKKPSTLEIAMAKSHVEKLRQFSEYDVIICKHQSYGEFPFKFNGKSKIILMAHSGGDDKIINYNDLEKVEIVREMYQTEITHTTTKTKGGVTRAVIGGSLFGVAGAVVGANTAKTKSIGTSTTSSNFNSYIFMIYLKNGDVYTLSGVPVAGILNKRPPKELLELEFYFDQIINSSEVETEISQSFESVEHFTPGQDNEHAMLNLHDRSLKRRVRIRRTKNVMLKSLVVSIVCFLLFLMALMFSTTLQKGTTNFVRKISGLPPLQNGSETLDIYDFLQFQEGEDTVSDNGELIKSQFSSWILDEGEIIDLSLVSGDLTDDVGDYSEQFINNNQDTFNWDFSNEFGVKEFYFEIDNTKPSINLWYHYSDKKFKDQRKPHITLTIDEYYDDTMTFTVENFWMKNNQIVKDGKYRATRNN